MGCVYARTPASGGSTRGVRGQTRLRGGSALPRVVGRRVGEARWDSIGVCLMWMGLSRRVLGEVVWGWGCAVWGVALGWISVGVCVLF